MKSKNSNLIPFALSLLIVGCAASERIPVEEIIGFTSSGVRLEGVLHLPSNSQKHPVAVFVHGSGMATRDDYTEFVTPLLRDGIGVFRYDKRGVGASQGVYSGVDTDNSEQMFSVLAGDAAAAIAHLKNDKRIDSNKVILIGGSQAGWIIPEVISSTPVWLSVCISGPLVPVGEEIYYSDLAERGAYAQDEADILLRNYRGPRGYDPVSRVSTMKNPALWIFGGKDVSIPVKRSMYVLDSIKTAFALPVDMKLYPDADHGLYNRARHQREEHVAFIIEWIGRFR